MKTKTKITGFARILAVTLVISGYLMSGAEVRAEYRKRIVIVSGQDAPGTAGAVFTDSWQTPGVMGLSQTGRVLFRAALQIGVGDATAENDEGLWVQETDAAGTIRLIARKGGLVPGLPVELGTQYFLKNQSFDVDDIFMDPAGQIGLNASFSPDGSDIDKQTGFFIEEGGELVLKLRHGTEVSSGVNILGWHSRKAVAFNAGRVLFETALQGSAVDSRNDVAICMYGPGGITVLAREFDPMPQITGHYLYESSDPLDVLTADGKTMFKTTGVDTSTLDKIVAVYYWDPDVGHVLHEVGGIGDPLIWPTFSRMNSPGNIALSGYYTDPTVTGLWTRGPHTDETLILTDSGYPADGAGGATFTQIGSFVLFDDEQVGLSAVTSDGKNGIWIGDQNGMRKVVRAGDPAPGVEEGMIFYSVNNMIVNRRGRVAFRDYAVIPGGNETYGIWAGNADRLELVTVVGEQIEIAPGDIRTIDDVITGIEAHERTGADGHPTVFNDGGELGIGVSFVEGGNALLIATPGLVVNSTDDDIDADTTDGICDTGGPLVNGKPECTLRAAIMEANNQAGRNKIAFNIPGSGIPSINYISNLPAITDPVVIDGTTQSGGLVALKGYIEGLQTSAQDPNPEDVHGFVFKADDLEVIGFSFTGFSGNGILIEDCDNARVTQCKPIGNHKHGILIKNSSDVTIGGSEPGVGNVIANNQEAGVYVESGDGNKIIGNSIFDNKLLGIDLAPVGVNPNDEEDPPDAANTGINYPFIDSVKTDPQLGSTIYGTVRGAVLSIHYIDIFYNDEGDESSHGEGKYWMSWTSVVTSYDGVGKFIAGAPALGAAQFVTATTTDQYNNTSEFSPWWPHKAIIIADDDEEALANEEFKLFRVNNDRPKMTEHEVAVITTDEKGRVDLNQYYREGTLSLADSLKVYRHLHSEPRPKVGVPALQTGFSVHLDNAVFDSDTYHMDYDTLGSDTLQKINLGHTTLAVNLVISIEWEAGDEYRDSVVSCMRILSNYLYDVTDGQLRLDSIIIFDDKVQWDNSDMHILADNYWRPRAQLDGFYDWDPKDEPHIFMSRRWYGCGAWGAERSWNDYPINVGAQYNYRAMAHELGHYFFNFLDEYKDENDPDRDPTKPLTEFPIYGIMQISSEPSPVCSELSSWAQYTDGRKNTRQWDEHEEPCWDTFEDKYEEIYGGIFAPILSPDHRELKEGAEYFLGPNDNLADLDYDVGALVWSNNLPQERKSTDVLVVLLEPVQSFPLSSVAVEHLHYPIPGGKRQWISQGQASSGGMIRVLGVNVGDSLLVDGRFYYLFPLPRRSAEQSAEPFAWFSGEFELTGEADATYYPMPVYGSFPLVVSTTSTATDLTLRLEAPNPFASEPSLELRTDVGGEGDYAFASSSKGYAATIADDLSNSGVFYVTAIDDSANSFFFHADYEVTMLPGDGTSTEVSSDKGDFDLLVDGSNSELSRAVVVSTDFPEIRGALSPDARRVSRVHTLNVYPHAPLTGENILRLSYSAQGLDNSSMPFTSETSVRLFRWDEAVSTWSSIGCAIDTAQKIVHAQITAPGSYAAFTTDIGSGIIETGETELILPDKFEVAQNYPNPFNARTTIQYALSEAGHVTVDVYDLLGRRVALLIDEHKEAGFHTVSWDAAAVASGAYFYRIQAGENVETRKMILLK